MNAVVTTNEQLPEPIPSNPMQMLARAVERGASMDQLQQLMDLQDRWEANQARKAFVAAMAAFKKDPPKIIKDKHVEFGNTKYDHATLGAVCSAIVEGLAKVGISHRWTVKQDQMIEVTCILTHELGHTEDVMLKAGPDTSGAKNAIQAIGSAVTYLQRYSLFCATGLAAMQNDDDGASACQQPAQQRPGEKINPRPDTSGVDKERLELLVRRVADILAQDKQERDIAINLLDVHDEVKTDEAMYTALADSLAKLGIINKSGYKNLIRMGLAAEKEDIR